MRRASKEASVQPSSRRRAKLAFGAFAVLLATLAIGVTVAAATAPTVTIDAPTNVTYTTVDVSGTVDPQDEETLYFFQYSTDGTTWSSSSIVEWLSPGVGPTNVSGTIEDLKPGTQYFVRLGARNGSGEVFSSEPDPSFTTTPVAKPALTISPVTAVTASGAHFAGTVNPNGVDSPFDTSWHFLCTPACPSLQGGSFAADTSAHPVAEDAEALEPNTGYEVSLIGKNLGGEEVAGPLSFHTERAAPVARAGGAEGASGDAATLVGYVVPRNSATTYRFEWGTGTSYGNLAPAAPVAVVPADNRVHRVTVRLGGLQQGVTYHYRLRATNTETSQSVQSGDRTFTVAAAPAACPNADIRAAQQVDYLGDCRAYEQVTPRVKNGLNAETTDSQVAADGNGLGYMTGPSQSLLDEEEGNRRSIYRSLRTATGWTTASLMPPTSFSVPSALNGVAAAARFSADLSNVFLVATDSWDPADTNTGVNNSDIYRRNPDRSLTWMTRGSGQQGLLGQQYFSNSPDGRWLYFGSREQLNPAEPVPLGAGPQTVHLYRSDGGAPEPLSILPDGSVDPNGASLGSTPNAIGSGNGINGSQVVRGAVSPDQSHVVFTSSAVENGAHQVTSTQLYVRDVAAGVTKQVSKAPGPGGQEADARVYYEGAAWGPGPNQGKIFFSTVADILGGHPGGGIYVYDVASGGLEFLTPGAMDFETCKQPTSNLSCAGVIAVAEDGSRVYFASNTALAGPSGAGQDQNQAGRTNLYVYDLPRHETAFIAKLDAGRGFRPGVGPASEVDSDLRGFNASLLQQYGERFQQAQISAGDGRVLVFQSRSRLTAFDPQGALELYRYDAGTGGLDCITCEDGASGDSWLGVPFRSNGVNVNSGMRNVPSSFVSADGSRVFFNTEESLVPRDTNGKDDAYEWHDGQLSLLSSGTGSEGSYVINASRDGRDAFVATLEQLTRSDTDSLFDVYDARAGGGFDETQQLRCGGDQCRGPLSSAPSGSTPATATFSAPGNRPQARPHKKPAKKHKKKQAKKRHGKHKPGKQQGKKRSGK